MRSRFEFAILLRYQEIVLTQPCLYYNNLFPCTPLLAETLRPNLYICNPQVYQSLPDSPLFISHTLYNHKSLFCYNITENGINFTMVSCMMQNFLKCLITLSILHNFGCQSLRHPSHSDSSQELLETKLELVQSQLNQGFPELALTSIRPLTQEHPNNKKVLTLSGIVFLALGNNHKAKKVLKKTYHLYPETDVALNLSSAYLELGQYKDAKKLLKNHRNDTNYPFLERIYHNFGLLYEKAGQPKVAAKYYRQALSELPSYYSSLYRLALIKKNLGQIKLATRLLQKAITICKVCYEPTQHLAIINMKLGLPGKARKILSDYLKVTKISNLNRKRAQKLLNKTKSAQ